MRFIFKWPGLDLFPSNLVIFTSQIVLKSQRMSNLWTLLEHVYRFYWAYRQTEQPGDSWLDIVPPRPYLRNYQDVGWASRLLVLALQTW